MYHRWLNYGKLNLTNKGGIKIIETENYKIILQIVKNPAIKSKTLETQFNLSRRQLSYRIDKINQWLSKASYEQITRTKQGHFIVDPTVKEALNIDDVDISVNDKEFYNVEQRQYIILLMLFNSTPYLSLDHFALDLKVSKNTVLNDIKKVKTQLAQYNLTLRYSRKQGYALMGDELQTRKLAIKLIINSTHTQLSSHEMRHFLGVTEDDMTIINKQMTKIESFLRKKYVDHSLNLFPYLLNIFFNRIEQGYIINHFKIDYSALSDTQEYKATEILLEPFSDVPMEERLYVTLHLLSTSMQWSEQPETTAFPQLKSVLITTLQRFEQITCIQFENKDQLLKQLLWHMKPAFYRIKYQLSDIQELENPLHGEYRELFHLVKQSIQPLEHYLGQTLPDNEIAYLTMLIGGSLRRQDIDIEQSLKAVVVCTQGHSVSQMMLQELRGLFPEIIFLDALSLSAFNNYSLDYDIVFAPMHVMTTKTLFITKSFLNAQEKKLLRQEVLKTFGDSTENTMNVEAFMETIKAHANVFDEEGLYERIKDHLAYLQPISTINSATLSLNNELNLKDLLPTTHIKQCNEVKTMDEAIALASEPLLSAQYIEPQYVKAMQQHFDDTYMVIQNNIAIPHAMSDGGVKRTAMSMLVLQEPLIINKQHPIHIIVVIAATDKVKHLRPLLQLRDLAQSNQDINCIQEAQTIQEIVQIIEQYSKIE